MKNFIFLLLSLVISHQAWSTGRNFWTPVSAEEASRSGAPATRTVKSAVKSLDLNAMASYLNTAPVEAAKHQAIILELPDPDGNFKKFSVWKNPLIPAELAAKYPGINTYSGQGIDDPYARIQLDVTRQGFHAMVFGTSKSYFIDPYNLKTQSVYNFYYRADAVNDNPAAPCGFNPSSEENIQRQAELSALTPVTEGKVATMRSAGSELRTYRLAMACTGEYALFHSPAGDKAVILSAIITSVNRVNGILETEQAVRVVIIPNTDTLIYTNAASDPYTNNNGAVMLGENQATVNAIIGTPNYDVGHVFSTGGGGIAQLGCICVHTAKARGVTGLPAPVGDVFDVDYVAHEMGHQFGANHTFSVTTGGCNGNISNPTAYEPGSGSTIMGYTGLCNPNNLQINSDAYYHTVSFDNIQNHVVLGQGNNCPVITSTGNTPPVITSVGGNYDIPILTPFILTGAAYDPDGDPITYCWEQFDYGGVGSVTTPTGNAPIFRSFYGVPEPYRVFPKLTSLVRNQNIVGEKLPSYARMLRFKLTVRDNRTAGGGVTYEGIPAILNVIDTQTPFQVTQPNTNVSWGAWSQQNITWDVSSTDQPPINVSAVNILLSTDSGFTYPYVLAANVPNTGMATVTLTNTPTTMARIKVEAVGNIFFDISNSIFEITPYVGLNEHNIESESVEVYPNPSSGLFNISWAGNYQGDINMKVSDITGKIVMTESLIKNSSGFIHKLDLSGLSKGVYFLDALTSKGKVTRKIILE